MSDLIRFRAVFKDLTGNDPFPVAREDCMTGWSVKRTFRHQSAIFRPDSAKPQSFPFG